MVQPARGQGNTRLGLLALQPDEPQLLVENHNRGECYPALNHALAPCAAVSERQGGWRLTSEAPADAKSASAGRRLGTSPRQVGAAGMSRGAIHRRRRLWRTHPWHRRE